MREALLGVLKRKFLWLLAAVPAALFAHGLAYVVQGRTMADASHAYFQGAAELGIGMVLLGAVGVGLRTILQPRRGMAAPAFVPLLIGLAIAQTALFCVLERFEGNAPTLLGCALQILTAVLVAALLRSLFLLLGSLAQIVLRWSYASRARGALHCVPLAPVARSIAIRVRLGASRFQRPPPIFA